jgi:glycosyltransferase involved in cell wall biosynthesis
MDISIIIPVFNEEMSIAEILTKVLELRFEGLEKEVVVVDDGSTDETPDILKDFSNVPEVKIIIHGKNLGKGGAIRTGIKNSTGRIISIQDSDLEYDPADLPRLIKPILQGENVVYGSRFLGKVENMKFRFYFGNKILSLFTRMLYGTPITDMETGFKIFRREVVENLNLESNGFDIEPEITAKILRSGFKIKEIPINYTAREKELKKISEVDGLKALFVLFKNRLR